MVYIIVPFIIWILIGVFFSIKEQYWVIFAMSVLTFVPCYLIIISILFASGLDVPRNPCTKDNEAALINLRGNSYLGISKDSDVYVYTTKDELLGETINTLERLEGMDIYVKTTTENFRMEHWESYMSFDAFPGHSYYIFYVPENGVCIIN